MAWTALEVSMSTILTPGALLIEKGSGLWGMGAKLLFGADHQHAALVTHDTRYVIEAVWDGVRVNRLDLSRDLEQYEIWVPACTAAQRSRAVYRAMSRTGEAYGYQQLLLAVLRRNLGLPAADVPGMWCSELISWAYDQVGYDLHLDLDAHEVGPWDLRNLARLERIA